MGCGGSPMTESEGTVAQNWSALVSSIDDIKTTSHELPKDPAAMYTSGGGDMSYSCNAMCLLTACTPSNCGEECAGLTGSGKAQCIKRCAEENRRCWDLCDRSCTTPKLYWSNSGKIPGKICKRFEDPDQNDPNSWDDNYLCSDVDLGLKPLSAAPLVGHGCTRVAESLDPDGWSSAYLCQNAALKLSWSQSGKPSGYTSCLLINEPNDPHGWNDNYLCWDY